MDTPNDAGGGGDADNRTVNGELQDQAISLDTEMEEGMYTFVF